jgi:hypothetical protein
MNHQDILSTAKATISQRGQEYGDALPSFVRAANIASAILDRKLTAFDISVVMMAVKMSRLSHQRTHEDSWVDLAAYVAFAAQFAGPATSDFNDIVKAQIQTDMEQQLKVIAEDMQKGAAA